MIKFDFGTKAQKSLYQVVGGWHTEHGALMFYKKEDFEAVSKEVNALLMTFVGQKQTESTRSHLASAMKTLLMGMGMYDIAVETEIPVAIEGPEHVMVLEDGSVYVYKIPDVMDNNGLNVYVHGRSR